MENYIHVVVTILDSWGMMDLGPNYVYTKITFYCYKKIKFNFIPTTNYDFDFTEQITSVDSLVMTSIACGEAHSMALNEWGQLYTWGSDLYSQLGEI